MKRNPILFIISLAFVVLFSLRGETANTIGWVNTPGNAYAVDVSGSYAYVADDFAGLQVINVSEPQNPTIVGTLDTPGHTHGVAMSGSYAYLADSSGGFLIVDVSTPNKSKPRRFSHGSRQRRRSVRLREHRLSGSQRSGLADC